MVVVALVLGRAVMGMDTDAGADMADRNMVRVTLSPPLCDNRSSDKPHVRRLGDIKARRQNGFAIG